MVTDDENTYDLFIIGGGVNGCGLARDAAGRGFRVGLAEMNDLAAGTSSASTKLIHGGLRYLEQHAFHLVRESLKEREVLWRIAPHIIRPLRFILPYHKGLRPAWMLRIGLFLYDHLGGRRELAPATTVHFNNAYGAPLKKAFRKGFEYSDARVDDSRLVVLNARHAAQLGADIMVGTEVVALRAKGKWWRIRLRDHRQGKDREVRAAFVANMAGPWINKVMHDALRSQAHPPVRLVQGSHIVVPALYEHDRAYIFQNPDGRIIFAIPYQGDYTLIGTTDRDYQGDPAKVRITGEEIRYLCAAASEYFCQPVTQDMIIWSYAGIRPLYDDGSARAQEATRGYVLKMTGNNTTPPLLNTYGGKITTYRKLAEDAMKCVEQRLGRRQGPWTADIPLPGGGFPHTGIAGVEAAIARAMPALDARTVARLAGSYGTEALLMFDHGQKPLGRHFGHGLYEPEVRWLVNKEWAATADDILWRRTKLGLRFSKKQRAQLASWLHTGTPHQTAKVCARAKTTILPS